MSAPTAVTVSTRPPLVTTRPCSSDAVPAWNTTTPSCASARIEPRDDVSLAIGRRRIAVRREHDADARRRRQLDRRVERARGRLRKVHEQVAREPRHEHLAFRVAETNVVLEHLRALGREHQPAEQHAAERCTAAARARAKVGKHRPLHHLVDDVGSDERNRRVRAHAARVRALVAVERALVVLRGRNHLGAACRRTARTPRARDR